MKQTVVSVRGQTVIPQEIRERFGIRPSTKLAWSTQDGLIIVLPIPEDPVKASFGMLAGKGLTFEDLMKERRQERDVDRQREARLQGQIERAAGARGATRRKHKA